MPLIQVANNGVAPAASGITTNMFPTVTVTQGTSTTFEMPCYNLPGLFFWVIQTAGLNGATWTPLFAVRNIIAVVTPAPDFQGLTTPLPLAIGVQSNLSIKVPCAVMGVTVSAIAGGANSVFTVILGASI
jgi:hypothetical protein